MSQLLADRAEDVDEVIDRQLRTLRDLSFETAGAKTAEEVYTTAARVLQNNPTDVPFARFYLVDGPESGVRPVAVAGDRDEGAHIGEPDSRDAVADGLTEAVRTRQPVVVDGLAERRNGTPGPAKPERVICLPLVPPSHPRAYGALVVGLSRTLDERYRSFLYLLADGVTGAMARLELQRLRDRLEQERAAIADIFAQSPVPVAILRGPDLVCEFVNTAYIKGVAGGRDIRGKPLLEAVPEMRGQGFDNLLLEVMRTGVPRVGRDQLLTGPFPDTYWTFLYAPVRGEDDRIESVIAICTEVTEQVEARKSLQALAEVAQSANRMKDEFLAMLGHELRNPLSPIVTALQLMRLRGASSREQDIIERQVGQLTRLVDDLLDVSRITRGKIELRRQDVELADVIARAIEMVSPLLERRRDRLNVEVSLHGLLVNVDPDRMAQVFSNLLNNAAKYSEAGSRIVVTAERAGENVRVCVKDEGVGIAPDMIGRVFDLFAQQSQTLERSQGGLGLGLAIVKSFVEMHGGAVSVHSQGVGKGSEFAVELPVAGHRREVGAAHRSRPSGAREEAERARILVVDDNDDAAETLKYALEGLGYTVAVAHDGPSALDLAKSFHPEVALLDIGLPVMDGYELAQRLGQTRETGQELHLVALTGYGQQTDRERSAAAGFERHLVKPVDLTKLEQVVQELRHPS